MKVLITGITGFAGSHLADYILGEHPDVEIYGIKRWRSRTDNIEHLVGRVKLYECDLRDAFSVENVVAEIRPDRIFHLAAQSYVPSSWSAPSESLHTNILGQLNLFESIKRLKIDPRIQIACSSEEYGLVYEDELPIKETNPLRPLSPYAVSKVSQDLLGFQYFRSFGLHVVRTRGFNHTGPRRGDVFVCSNFAKQIVTMEKGLEKPILKVGNLDARRDFTDVRDTVRGYWLSLERCDAGDVYNISSGRTYKIKDVVDMLIKNVSIDIEIKIDPERLRPSDVPVLVGDNSKFHEKTGWKPEIPFEKTLSDLLDYWRAKVNSQENK